MNAKWRAARSKYLRSPVSLPAFTTMGVAMNTESDISSWNGMDSSISPDLP